MASDRCDAADHCPGHLRRRRAHPGRRDPARGRHGAVRPAGGHARHQLHHRPAADADRGRGPGPVRVGAGERAAERGPAAAHRPAQLRVQHRRRITSPAISAGSPRPGCPWSAAAAAPPPRTSAPPPAPSGRTRGPARKPGALHPAGPDPTPDALPDPGTPGSRRARRGVRRDAGRPAGQPPVHRRGRDRVRRAARRGGAGRGGAAGPGRRGVRGPAEAKAPAPTPTPWTWRCTCSSRPAWRPSPR